MAMRYFARGIGALVVGVLVVLVWHGTTGSAIPERVVSVPQLLGEIRSDKIKQVVVYSGGAVIGTNENGTYRIRSAVPVGYSKLYEVLDEKGIDYWVSQEEKWPLGAFILGLIAGLSGAGLAKLVMRRRPKLV